MVSMVFSLTNNEFPSFLQSHCSCNSHPKKHIWHDYHNDTEADEIVVRNKFIAPNSPKNK